MSRKDHLAAGGLQGVGGAEGPTGCCYRGQETNAQTRGGAMETGAQCLNVGYISELFQTEPNAASVHLA